MNKMTLLALLLILPTGVLPTRVFAETPAGTVTETINIWTGDAELGYVATSGNTQTEIINAKGKVQLLHHKWKHTGIAEAFNSADHNARTAERYFLSVQSDFHFSERRYIFALLSFEDDHFSGYDHRFNETIGYGQRVLEREKLFVDMEIGPGARQSKLIDSETDNELIMRFAIKLEWQLTPASSFNQSLYSEVGQDATVNKSVSALTAKIADNLAMKASWTVKHNSNAPVGVEKRDRETAVTLVFGFK